MDSFFFENGNCVTYFDSFDTGHISEQFKRFIGNSNIIIKYLQNTGQYLDNIWIHLH